MLNPVWLNYFVELARLQEPPALVRRRTRGGSPGDHEPSLLETPDAVCAVTDARWQVLGAGWSPMCATWWRERCWRWKASSAIGEAFNMVGPPFQ